MAKKWTVIKATQRPIKGVEAAGVELPFGRQGAFEVTDAAVAAEIEARHGGKRGDVVVTEREHHEPGHRHFWGAWPEMPWKKEKQ